MKADGGEMNTTKRITFLAAASLAASSLLGANVPGDAHAAEAAPSPSITLSQSYRESQQDIVAYQKVEPIKMLDNLSYVGTGYVSAYLISTSDGLILIDTVQEPYVDHVLDSIRKVGHDPADIKYILISHGHLDHFGGAARIQELSGARVGAIEEDWQLIEATGSRPARDGGPSPRVPVRDMVIKQGDTVTLGDTTLILHNTPGHTPGVLSVEFTAYDNGTPHRTFFSGGTGGRGGIEAFEAAVASTSRVTQIPNIEVFLPNHAWNAGNPYPGGSVFERAERLAHRRPGDPNPFVDGTAWTQWITRAHERNVQRLEEMHQSATR